MGLNEKDKAGSEASHTGYMSVNIYQKLRTNGILHLQEV